MDWIDLAEGRGMWWAVMNNLTVILLGWEFKF